MPKGVYERFWLYVDKDGRINENLPEYQHLTRCWSWTLKKDKNGYGIINCNDKTMKAHRFSYQLHHPLTININDIKMCVLHKCDNPECTNPEHLFLGTHIENMRDKEEKGRGNQLKGEQHSLSKFTETQVREIRKKYAEGNTSTRKLGDEYKVYQSTIVQIVNRKTWNHI